MPSLSPQTLTEAEQRRLRRAIAAHPRLPARTRDKQVEPGSVPPRLGAPRTPTKLDPAPPASTADHLQTGRSSAVLSGVSDLRTQNPLRQRPRRPKRPPDRRPTAFQVTGSPTSTHFELCV